MGRTPSETEHQGEARLRAFLDRAVGGRRLRAVVEAFRLDDRRMVSTVGHEAKRLEGEGDADPSALVDFLREEVLPHLHAREVYLYPAVEPLVRAHGSALEAMAMDREAIESCAHAIERVATALQGAPQRIRWILQADLRRLTIQLETLLRLHLLKEERLYLPLLERYPSKDLRRRAYGGGVLGSLVRKEQ